MVRSWIGKHKLSRSLQRLEHPHSVGLQIRRRDHGCDIEQDVWILLEQEGALLFDHSVELLSVAFWHSIPQLWLTPVAVIDRGEHQVLVVPAECGELHPNIDPRHIDSRHIFNGLELEH